MSEEKESEEVSEQEQKRLAVQQEAINNQKALARNQSLELLDGVVAQVSLNREGHAKVQRAVQTLWNSLGELETYEKTLKPVEEEG